MLKKVDQARLGEYFSKELLLAAINNVVFFLSVFWSKNNFIERLKNQTFYILSVKVSKTENQKYRIMEYKTDFPEMVTI